MKTQQVPQDMGLAGPMRELTYAVDADGRYQAVPSYGWEPKTIALVKAWETIRHQLNMIRDRVHAGTLSPLAWHMARHQMDIRLLSKYAGISRYKVWLQLKPRFFNRMKPETIEKYAAVFDTTPEQLKQIPDAFDLSFLKNDQRK